MGKGPEWGISIAGDCPDSPGHGPEECAVAVRGWTRNFQGFLLFESVCGYTSTHSWRGIWKEAE